MYQDTSATVASVLTSTLASAAVSGNNPVPCAEGRYFSGSECRPSTVIQISRGLTTGVIIPVKSRLKKNYEWTVETWVYVDSSASTAAAAVFVLEGDGTKLSARREAATLVGEWIYDSMGDKMTINSFTTDAWHHVALVAQLDSPHYDAKLYLDGDSTTAQTVEIILKSNVKTFEYLTLGMDRSNYDYTGIVAMKEIRVWDVALHVSTISRQMRRQIKNPGAEIRLVYYYPMDSENRENLYNRAFEGDLEDLKLWNTAHTYTSGGPDPSTVGPPNITSTASLGIPLLTICNQNSFYSASSHICMLGSEEAPIGLEQSLAPFTIPLTSYYFQPEWTFEFWILINQIGGVSTSLFSQTCYPAASGTLSLKKAGVTDNLVFTLTDSGSNITFPQAKRTWTHYAFVNDASAAQIYAYKNGVQMSASMAGSYDGIQSCAMTVGEFSTINLIYGKFKEIRIWNGTRTALELRQGMHRALDPKLDRALVTYVPMSENGGGYVFERVRGAAIPLTISRYSRELWTAQGDLRICRTPYVYSSADNVCICTLSIFNPIDSPACAHARWL